MRTSVSSHTDYTAFRNINRYGANLAAIAPSVLANLSKKVAHPDFLVKLFVKRFYLVN